MRWQARSCLTPQPGSCGAQTCCPAAAAGMATPQVPTSLHPCLPPSSRCLLPRPERSRNVGRVLGHECVEELGAGTTAPPQPWNPFPAQCLLPLLRGGGVPSRARQPPPVALPRNSHSKPSALMTQGAVMWAKQVLAPGKGGTPTGERVAWREGPVLTQLRGDYTEPGRSGRESRGGTQRFPHFRAICQAPHPGSHPPKELISQACTSPPLPGS